MKIPVFLSHPSPHLDAQSEFIEALRNYLRARDLEPRTLGVNDFDMDTPLRAVRRLMLESDGLITVAFRRTWINDAVERKGADVSRGMESRLTDRWLTSPWCHIEPAMAFQLGLPIILLRERGVIADGLLERGVVGLYMPSFDLEEGATSYLEGQEWNAIVNKWESQVRSVVENKGNPPKLF